MARWKRISAMIPVQNHAFLVERMKSIHAGSMGEGLITQSARCVARMAGYGSNGRRLPRMQI